MVRKKKVPESRLWLGRGGSASGPKIFVSFDGNRWIQTKREPNADGSDDLRVVEEITHGGRITYEASYLRDAGVRFSVPGSWR